MTDSSTAFGALWVPGPMASSFCQRHRTGVSGERAGTNRLIYPYAAQGAHACAAATPLPFRQATQHRAAGGLPLGTCRKQRRPMLRCDRHTVLRLA